MNSLFDYYYDLFPLVYRLDSFKKSEKKSYFNSFSRVKEKEKKWIIELIAPGIKKENLKIETKQDELIIEYKNSKLNENEEIYTSDFKESYSLPKNIDRNGISANYKDGILKILIEKPPEEIQKDEKTRTIEVK